MANLFFHLFFLFINILIEFLFQISANGNLNLLSTSILQSLQYAGNTLTNNMFILQSLLPVDTTNYYRYNGSLTVPRCSETVVWSVFTDTLYVSLAQVSHHITIIILNITFLKHYIIHL